MTRARPAAMLPRLLAAGLFMALAVEAAADPVNVLEARAMTALAAVQARADTRLAPFTTDGCSGGLSAGWTVLAGRLPAFGRALGDRPPWEACCVAHDLAYWRGPARDGVARRLEADRGLRACVADTGRTRAAELARRLDVPPAQVSAAFELAAEVMFAAVRLGGGPCTPFAWRWGYGWPECAPGLAWGGPRDGGDGR
ncbi:MAG: hypothetical protein PHF72_09560 [Gammaproteobacteria bacterium]|nr:hypothetical protein [Gammaproteobacteria bacterium]